MQRSLRAEVDDVSLAEHNLARAVSIPLSDFFPNLDRDRLQGEAFGRVGMSGSFYQDVSKTAVSLAANGGEGYRRFMDQYGFHEGNVGIDHCHVRTPILGAHLTVLGYDVDHVEFQKVRVAPLVNGGGLIALLPEEDGTITDGKRARFPQNRVPFCALRIKNPLSQDDDLYVSAKHVGQNGHNVEPLLVPESYKSLSEGEGNPHRADASKSSLYLARVLPESFRHPSLQNFFAFSDAPVRGRFTWMKHTPKDQEGQRTPEFFAEYVRIRLE